MKLIKRDRPLFIFDGHCVLCSTGAAFVMRHDRKGIVQFASAQSDLGAEIYTSVALPLDETFLLIDSNGCHTKSDGYFRLAKLLGGWWRLAVIGKVIPRPIRDWMYDWVATNRYRWFGKTDCCALLTQEQRDRLIISDPSLLSQLGDRA